MKTVIVTGGSRGIGKCIAENLAKEGYNVVLNYNKSVKEAKKTKEELEKQGHSVRVVSMPSMNLFDAQSDEYKESVLPNN